MVHKAEDDIAQTIGLLGDTYTAATPMLPFKCRLDLLYLHCRLVMLQEAIRIIQFVKEAHDSKFMEVLIAKLRLGILAEAEDHIDEAELLIGVSGLRYLDLAHTAIWRFEWRRARRRANMRSCPAMSFESA